MYVLTSKIFRLDKINIFVFSKTGLTGQREMLHNGDGIEILSISHLPVLLK